MIIILRCLPLFFLISSLTFAQSKSLSSKSPFSEQLQQLEVKPQDAALTEGLEGPIDPDTYVLGPGDQLMFKVWGNLEFQQLVIVTPTGKLPIPTIGEIDCKNRTLTESEQTLRAKASNVYNSQISLQLVRVRRMKVLISGAVEEPGAYEVLGVDRLSTLITYAGGFIEEEKDNDEDAKLQTPRMRIQGTKSSGRERDKLVEETVKLPSLRHIKIEDREGNFRYLDYQRFQRTGNAEFNPILRDGDRVHVPLIDVKVGVVDIFGAVKSPGEYEYVEGDRLVDIIELAGGYRADAFKNDINIVRIVEGVEENNIISIDLTDDNERGPLLKPDDRIFVRRIPEYKPKHQVIVNGEVMFPGVYPIDKDKTKLSDIIVQCGGFTDRANIRSAKVIRKGASKLEDPEFERLQLMSVTDMSTMEYEYFKTRSRYENPAVVVNFDDLFEHGDDQQDILLWDEDIIEIPSISLTVNVTGQVSNPGLVRYSPGEDFEYYIEKAGGFSWNARKGKIRLIKYHTGRWVKPKRNTPIDIGDTIFVPEKQEIDYWETWKDLLLVISQIATIVLVFRTVS